MLNSKNTTDCQGNKKALPITQQGLKLKNYEKQLNKNTTLKLICQVISYLFSSNSIELLFQPLYPISF